MKGRVAITICAGILAVLGGSACSPLSSSGVSSCAIQDMITGQGAQRNLNDTILEQMLAQSFKATGNVTVTGVSLRLISTYAGTTPPNLALSLAIQGDAATAGPNAASTPNGVALGTGGLSTTKISNLFPSTYVFSGFTSITLTANNYYWLVLSEPGASPSSTTFISWEADATPTQLWPALVSSGVLAPIWTAVPSLIFNFSVGC